MAPLESVESLGKIVLSESQDKGEWTLRSAREVSKKVMEDASAKARENSERIIQEGRQSAEKEKQKLLSTADMEVKKLLLNSKESIIDSALEKAKKKFEGLKEQKEYKNILLGQIISSIRELDGNRFIVEFYKGDKFEISDVQLKKIEKDTKRKGLKIELKEISEDIGGIIVREMDGKISINNSFESILNRKKSEIRVRISKIFFQ